MSGSLAPFPLSKRLFDFQNLRRNLVYFSNLGWNPQILGGIFKIWVESSNFGWNLKFLWGLGFLGGILHSGIERILSTLAGWPSWPNTWPGLVELARRYFAKKLLYIIAGINILVWWCFAGFSLHYSSHSSVGVPECQLLRKPHYAIRIIYTVWQRL